ncbi:hypothetical protein O3682_09215, partial [Neisseria sp. 27098_8_112]|uniref:hypothetical protein n=1 Tax=Neisseria sp. 27098_8_112 TaxID=3003682 RepID=UPI00352DC8A5
GLLKEGAHGKSPKCLGGNLGDFGEFCKGLRPSEKIFSDGLLTSQPNSRNLKKNSPSLSFSSIQAFNLIKPCYIYKQGFPFFNPASLNYYHSTEKAV